MTVDAIPARTTRRAILTGAMAASLPVGSAGGTQLDAELIATCEKFDAIEQRTLHIFSLQHTLDQERLNDPEVSRLRDLQATLVDQICMLQAITIDGIKAKALSLTYWEPEILKVDPDDFWTQRLIGSLLRDLVT